jgi:hypothetical protein
MAAPSLSAIADTVRALATAAEGYNIQPDGIPTNVAAVAVLQALASLEEMLNPSKLELNDTGRIWHLQDAFPASARSALVGVRTAAGELRL